MGDRGDTATESTPPRRGWSTLVVHISSHKIDFALWATRMTTITFTVLYLIPIWGNPYMNYQRALISNAATSALRLHQRLPPVQFTREFFSLMLLEDSCHYLLYSLIFLYSHPITLALMPVFLFAALHSSSYSLTMLDQLGMHSWWGARFLISVVEVQQRNMLRLISFTEIFLMPLLIIMIFMGHCSLLLPFIYYRFLGLRYSSRRNPFTRQVFHELRLVTEMQINRPGFPAGLRGIFRKVISFVERLAPPTPN